MLTIGQRIFSYAAKDDKLLLFAAASASICTGITLPIMNVVFGTCSMVCARSCLIAPAQLVGAFGAFYSSDEGEGADIFTETINKYVYGSSLSANYVLWS